MKRADMILIECGIGIAPLSVWMGTEGRTLEIPFLYLLVFFFMLDNELWYDLWRKKMGEIVTSSQIRC